MTRLSVLAAFATVAMLLTTMSVSVASTLATSPASSPEAGGPTLSAAGTFEEAVKSRDMKLLVIFLVLGFAIFIAGFGLRDVLGRWRPRAQDAGRTSSRGGPK